MTDSCTLCSPGALTAARDRQEFGARVVSQTMKTMNQMQAHRGADRDLGGYRFQEEVLGAYAGIGATINVTV